MSNKFLFDIGGTTGQSPSATTAADAGEIALNLVDSKIWARASSGAAQVVADKILPYSASKAYKANDLTVRGTQLLQCIANIPAKTYDANDWTVISPPADSGSTEILRAPTTADHNTVDLSGNPTFTGLEIVPATGQSADLFRAGGTGPVGGRRARIDARGFPSFALSGATTVITQVGHPFGARGQVVSYNGTQYLKSISTDVSTRIPVGIVDEVIDANTFVLRTAGMTNQLQTSAFPGGVITKGAIYYLSSVEGELSLSPPASGQAVPVMVTTHAANSALVIISPKQALLRDGDAMEGGLSMGSATVSDEKDLSRHISLYGTTYGFSVTASQLNIVSGNGGQPIKLISSAINLSANTTVNGSATVTGDIFAASGTGTMKLSHNGTYGYLQNLAAGDINFRNSSGTVVGTVRVDASASAHDDSTLMTRLKGDNRWLKLSGGTVTGTLQINGATTVSMGGFIVDRTGEAAATYVNIKGDASVQRGVRIANNSGTYVTALSIETSGALQFGGSANPVVQYVASSTGRHNFYCGTGNLDAALDSDGFYLFGGTGLATTGKLTVNGSIDTGTLAVTGGIALGHGGSNGYLDNSEGGQIQFRWSGTNKAALDTDGYLIASVHQSGGLTFGRGSNHAFINDVANTGNLYFQQGGVDRMTIRSVVNGGEVVIDRDGTSSNPAMLIKGTYTTGVYNDSNGRFSIYADSTKCAQFDFTGTILNASVSVVTREKGDARYAYDAAYDALLDLLVTKGTITSGERTTLKAVTP